jgi:peptide chain release factor subunit 1
VPGTITWDQLRELAAFRAERGCAVSLYLDLDPSTSPTAADVGTRVNALLGEAERRLAQSRGSLGHEAKAGIRADIDRVGRWFGTEFDRDGVRGVAVFADGLDNFWTTVDLGEPVVDDVKIGAELFLTPLMPVVGRGEGAIVGVIGRERGQVFRLEGGRLREIADRTDPAPGRHDQGGWSQANYERHIEDIVGRHLRSVAATLDACVRRNRGVRVVLVGAEEARAPFEQMLSHEARACLIGWTSVEAHADAPRVLAAVRPLLDRWWENREAELLDRWHQEAAKNGRATAGWEDTLEAASDGRVDLLLAQLGVDRPAYECPACGRAQMTNGGCPIDGTTMESRADGLDVAVHKTLVNGGTVQVIRERRDLEPVGGIAALLRY